MMQKQIAIAEDTNEKVRSLYSTARRAAFLRFAYWALIIGATIWSLQYIAPYLKIMQQTYSTLQTELSAIPGHK